MIPQFSCEISTISQRLPPFIPINPLSFIIPERTIPAVPVLRILHVIHRLDPREGGPPAVVARLAAAQASFDDTIVAILHHPGGESSEAFAAVPGFVRVTRHAIAPGALAAWLDTHLASFDVLHLHGVWDRILLAAAAEARRRRIPYAVVPHGMLDPWCLTGQGVLKGLKKKLALAVTHRALLHHAAFLHVLNADEARLIDPLGLTPPKVVIPNGVFEREVSPLPPPGAFRVDHPELADEPYILFLSRLHHKKGLDILADAFAEVLRRGLATRLVVAGPDDGARAPFEAQCRSLGIADRVHLVGPLFGPTKLAAFADAHAFCLPSRQEGFSVAITEALACGVPVVISDQCHFPEVATEGVGRVTSLDPNAVADGLVWTLNLHPVERRSLSECARAMILDRYTWPAIAVRTIEAYRAHASLKN
jgi:glycosyltransferase involved in cell wall biosynthesis